MDTVIYQHVPSKLSAFLEKMEKSLIEEYSSNKIIEHALLLGSPSQIPLLLACKAQTHHLACNAYPNASLKKEHLALQICFTQFTDLPYQKDCMDLIILPHVLEFTTEPWLVLEEAAECLSARGTLILFSLSPFSRFIPVFDQKNKLHCAPLLSSTTKALLNAQKLRIIASRPFFSIFSGFSNEKWGRLFEKKLARYLPFLCNAYCIVAQKTSLSPRRSFLNPLTTSHPTLALDGGCAARTGSS